MEVYHLCADDIPVRGDLFVKAKSEEEAFEYFIRYVEAKMRKHMVAHKAKDVKEGMVRGTVEEEH